MNERVLAWDDLVLDLQVALSGTAQPVYIVGGAVRDALLRWPLTDLDLVVPDKAISFARHIANLFDGDFFALDRDRDVGRALVTTRQGRVVIDVARMRGADLHADLLDRDFTINALAVDLRGDLSDLIDPLGGEADLINKVLRRCSPGALAHDPLRSLRAVRQSTQFGLRIEPQTLADVRANGPRLQEMSPERVRDEFFKLLGLRNVDGALRVTQHLGLLPIILPEIAALSTDDWQRTLAVIEALDKLLAAISYRRTDNTAANFSLGMLVMQFDRFRSELAAHLASVWPNERSHSALLVLAALLHRLKPQNSLALSNAEWQRVQTIIHYQAAPLAVDTESPLAIYRFWRATGVAGVDICLLTAAQKLAEGPLLAQNEWLILVDHLRVLLDAYYHQRERYVDPPVLLDGNMLLAELAIKPGPRVGHILEQVREGQVEGRVTTRAEALAYARQALDDQP